MQTSLKSRFKAWLIKQVKEIALVLLVYGFMVILAMAIGQLFGL